MSTPRVRDLIAVLQAQDPDAPVALSFGGKHWDLLAGVEACAPGEASVFRDAAGRFHVESAYHPVLVRPVDPGATEVLWEPSQPVDAALVLLRAATESRNECPCCAFSPPPPDDADPPPARK